MKKRDLEFLMIGFGLGVSLMEGFLYYIYSHMFIFGVTNRAALLIFAIPPLIACTGALLLYRERTQK